jgi:hypothetical protein
MMGFMPNDIFFYVYCSKATKPFSEADLLELLTRSRENNAKVSLTGVLLYKDGNFMQALEGPEPAIRELLKKIHGDSRHQDVVRMLEGRSADRQFPYWYMGFQNLNSEEVKNTPGYTEFLNTPLTIGLAADPTASQRLLHLFKKGARPPGQVVKKRQRS